MERNVGTVDSHLRITGGLALLAWGAARLAREGAEGWGLLLVLLGAATVAEGITRFCPVLALLGMSTVEGPAQAPAPAEPSPPSRPTRRRRAPAREAGPA